MYHGEEVADLPHLILEFGEGILAHSAYSPFVFRSTNSYCHDIYGTFIATGPDIDGGKKIFGAEIIDITPTILSLMGVPVPNNMDGRVLTHIFRGEKDEYRDLHSS